MPFVELFTRLSIGFGIGVRFVAPFWGPSFVSGFETGFGTADYGRILCLLLGVLSLFENLAVPGLALLAFWALWGRLGGNELRVRSWLILL